MIQLGICNELFEGWDFARVCQTVSALGYQGLEIAPFTLAPRITDVSAERRRELRTMVEDAGLKTIGLHWLLAKTEGFYLTSPDAQVRRRTGDYLVALAEATRDLGGSLMVFGSPKQRDLLPGVSHDQAAGLRPRSLHPHHAIAERDRRRFVPRAPGSQRDQFPQHLCRGDGSDRPGQSPSVQASHGRESPERRDRDHRARPDPPVCPQPPDISTLRMSTCEVRAWETSISSRSCKPWSSPATTGGSRSRSSISHPAPSRPPGRATTA